MNAKRLNKRQLREQQELQELADVETPSHAATPPPESAPNSDSEPPVATTVTTASSLFAALGDEQASEPESEPEPDQDATETHQSVNSSKKKKKNKKKKKAQVADQGEQDATHVVLPPSSAKKSKETSGKDVSEMSTQEFDALLASQAQLNAQLASTSDGSARSAHAGASVSSFRTHLSLDPRNLDPGVELRRQFGSAAIKAYQAEAGAAGRSASSGARARAQATNSNLKVRSILCTPKDYWPPIARSFTGMSMDVFDDQQVGRISTWKHSKAYRHVQMQFLQAVKSYEPNSLMALLRVYPYHIDTLLQMSEYSRHQGDLGQAGDFNDRALFAFERCASPHFVTGLSSSSSGPAMVNFNKIENRAFYLALHRQIGFLGRRGTWRTALEWAKLLLGLGQDGQDHHAALLWIDFLAIKSRQHRWLLELMTKLDEQKARRNGVSRIDDLIIRAVTPIDATDRVLAGEPDSYTGTLDWCVGLQYARALALHAVEKEEGDKTHARSTAALRLAIARYPGVVPLLCNKVGVDLPSKIASHPVFQLESRYSASSAGETLSDLLTHIYVLRSESLWKESEMAQWLRSTAVGLADTLSADADKGKSSIRKLAGANTVTKQGVYRHVLVSDLPDALRQQLIAFLPPAITSSSEQMDSFDPVPPRTSSNADDDDQVAKVTRYDDEYFAPVLADQAQARSRAPANTAEDAVQQQGMMQVLLRALQGIGRDDGAANEDEEGSGWDNAMADMDDETRADVLAQLMDIQGMPGGFDDQADLADVPAENGAPRGGGAFAALRGALDAIWGGTRPPSNTTHDQDNTDNESP